MTYKEKAKKFRDLVYAANGGEKIKWRNPEELQAYLEVWGGRVKEDRKRKRGYLVSLLQGGDPILEGNPIIVAEVPMDFAMKVLSMGGFP